MEHMTKLYYRQMLKVIEGIKKHISMLNYQHRGLLDIQLRKFLRQDQHKHYLDKKEHNAYCLD